MKNFNTTQELINAKATETLKAFAYDQPEAINWTISGLKKEIEKERKYVAETKVLKQFHPFCAKQDGVPVGKSYIKNFGYSND